MKILQHLALSGPFFATFCSAQDLAEVAITNNLNLLAAAAGAAGILPALSDPGPLTIFAPDDTAFTGLPVGALSWLLLPGNTGFLVDVLGMHVVPGQTVLSTDLMDGMTLTTLNQETLTITATESGGFMVNDANIIQADLIAENGVIHIIDSVLIPERIELPFNLVEFGMGSGMFPTLFALLEATDLTDVLTSAIFTIFPPTEEAFAKLPPGTAGFLLRNPSLLTDVLLYHVVEGLLPSSNITDGMMVPTALAGSNITFGVDGNITLNDRATVVQGDLTALNGIVHVIDEVLIPPSFPPFPASLPAIVSELDNFSTLLTALNITGLVDVLAEEGPFTVLAPTDEAFANLPNGTLEALLAEEGLTTLIDILLFHVIPGEVIDEATMQAGPIDAETALGQDIAIDGGIVGDATVISFDTFGLNGVIHAIDTVLIPSPLPTIAEVGIASGLFDVVFGELTAAGLGTALDVEGPITVFGPIDPVFENPEINTTDFFADPVGALLYHVCDGGYAYEDLYDGLVLTNFLSQPLYISVSPTGVRKVNGVEIIDPDFIGSNGFIHGISGIISSDFDPNEVIETPVNATTMPTNTTETPAPVSANMTMTPAPATPVPSNMTMTPAPVASTVPATPAPTPPAESSGSPVGELPGIAEVGIAYGEFDTLFTAIQNAGLADALEVDGPLTVFAPTDTAFESLSQEDLGGILANPVNTLLYHVVNGEFPAEALMDGMELTNFLGSTLYVSIGESGEVMINNAIVTDPNLFGYNGVIHGISSIISADFVPAIDDTSAPVDATPDTPAPVAVTTPVPAPVPTPAPVEVTDPPTASAQSLASSFLSLALAAMTGVAVAC